MGECEKVGKMRFYPKPDARPNSRADLSTETNVSATVSDSPPIPMPAVACLAAPPAGPCKPRRSWPGAGFDRSLAASGARRAPASERFAS